MGLEIRSAGPGRAAARGGVSAGLFEVPHHLWRTDDGRLVESGHLDARRLAYTRGQLIPVETAAAEGLLPAPVLAPAVPPYPPDAAPPGRPETPPAKKSTGTTRRKQQPQEGAGDA